jgi:hypothetical protein
MKFNKEALIEAIKEPLRLLVLAVIPFGIAYFTEINAQWALIAVVVLRFVDKWLHEIQAAKPEKKQEEGLLGLKGLTGF